MKAKLSLLSAAILVGTMNIGVANADLKLITLHYGDDKNVNDCSGVFGQGFENCEVNGSPVVVKYDYTENNTFISQINLATFDSIDGSEFAFTQTGADYSTGYWAYIKGTGDPDIRYWVAKGGQFGFNLHWYVPDSFNCDLTNGLTDCLNQAVPTTSGEWFTPYNNNQQRAGLSHLTFYDTSNGKPPEEAPAPGVLGLLGLGLLGLAWARRRV